jgi:hypothetical protein
MLVSAEPQPEHLAVHGSPPWAGRGRHTMSRRAERWTPYENIPKLSITPIVENTEYIGILAFETFRNSEPQEMRKRSRNQVNPGFHPVGEPRVLVK